jgi:hypothetical protein
MGTTYNEEDNMTGSDLNHTLKWMTFLVFVFFLSGCQSAYYNTMEKLGYHKRDLMVDRVQEARDAQEEAKEQFESALEKFRSVVKVDGGKLEEKYDLLKAEYDKSKSKADAMSERINSVENVAKALFSEWELELNQYTNASLRKSSKTKLTKTRRQYTQLINAMKKAERKIAPVLLAFNDQVLFLKHNLNARAIGSLKSELISVEADVASLVREMEASITEANAFISALEKE